MFEIELFLTCKLHTRTKLNFLKYNCVTFNRELVELFMIDSKTWNNLPLLTKLNSLKWNCFVNKTIYLR